MFCIPKHVYAWCIVCIRTWIFPFFVRVTCSSFRLYSIPVAKIASNAIANTSKQTKMPRPNIVTISDVKTLKIELLVFGPTFVDNIDPMTTSPTNERIYCKEWKVISTPTKIHTCTVRKLARRTHQCHWAENKNDCSCETILKGYCSCHVSHWSYSRLANTLVHLFVSACHLAWMARGFFL